jgi:hypothetical protein
LAKMRNPRHFKGYGAGAWGITASEGSRLGGATRPDDGTLAPWAVVASLPFAPEIVLPTLRSMEKRFPETRTHYGFVCSFNPPTVRGRGGGWI